MYIKIGLGILALMLCPKDKIKTAFKVNTKKKTSHKKNVTFSECSSDLDGFKDVKFDVVNPKIVISNDAIIEESNELFQRKFDKNKPDFNAKQKPNKQYIPIKAIHKDIFNNEIKYSKYLKHEIK